MSPHTPDETADPERNPEQARERFAERLLEAGVSTKRFIDVHDGSKGTTNHDQHEPDDPALRGNYGVYGGPGDGEDVTDETRWLVDVDVDDYADDQAGASTDGLDSLPETFTIESPHTDGETGGHRYYVVIGDVASAFEERVGVKNPSPPWGEVRAANQYCVGPGSQLAGCDKEWCDECAEPDGGYYRIADDRPIEVLELETFVGAIIEDLPDERADSSTDSGSEDSQDTDTSTADNYTPDLSADVKAVIRANTWISDYLIGVETDVDRSRKDFAVCRTFANTGVAEEDAREVLDDSDHTKVSTRGDDYWKSTWRRAVADARGDVLTATADAEGDGSEKRASTDGSGEAVVAPGADASETPDTAAEDESDGDDEDAETGNAGSWALARELFRSSERGTTGEAKQMAAMCLLDANELVTVAETDTVWRYDPETGIYHEDSVPALRKQLADGLRLTYSRDRVGDILHRVRSETYLPRDALGAPEGLVCVHNGVLDLRDPENVELLDHSPEYRFTWRLDAPYDPNAEGTKFREFLGSSVRPEDISKLQEYVGDALRHWRQPRTHCAIVGPTDAGKGVFLRVIKGVFGAENVATESLYSLSATRWGTAQLLNRPLNVHNELSTGALKHPEMIKTLAGSGDAISAERKGHDPFTFVPTANHLFATNVVPGVQGADDAFYNRWLFVTFPTTVPLDEQIEDLDEAIIEDDDEAAGVLEWIIEGYVRYATRDGSRFDGERSIAEKEDMWSAYGDSTERFAATCVTTDGCDGDDLLVKKDAYAAYKAMCNDVGISIEDQRKLTAALKKKEGVGDTKRTVESHFDDASRPRVFTGLRLTDAGRGYFVDAQRGLGNEGSEDGEHATDANQTALTDAGASATEAEDATDDAGEPQDETPLPQRQAVRSLLEKIEQLTDENDGEPVHIDAVAEAVVHTDDRARHLIQRLTADGTLIEDPEQHVRLA